jgi:Flp pilus assembly protein TadG
VNEFGPELAAVFARTLRSLWWSSDGSALVEGALLLPMLCALLFGVYEFSWYFYQQHLVSTGLRDAARYLARSVSPCDTTSPSWAANEAHAKNLATTGSINGGTARVRGWTAAMVTSRCRQIDNQTAANGLRPYRGPGVIHAVTVSTRFTDPSLGFFGLLGLRPPTIAVSHSERVIGPG